MTRRRQNVVTEVRRSSRLAALAQAATATTDEDDDGSAAAAAATVVTPRAARTARPQPLSARRRRPLVQARRTTSSRPPAARQVDEQEEDVARTEAKEKKTKRKRTRQLEEEDDDSEYEGDKENRKPTTTRKRARSSGTSSKRAAAAEDDPKGKGKEKAEEGKATSSTAVGDTPSALQATEVPVAPPPDCSICFDAIKVQGQLNSCEHPFCFECISTWAEKANLCPLCKRRFSSITKKPWGVSAGPQTPSGGRRGGPRTRKRAAAPEKVRVRKRDYRFTESDEEFYYREFLEQEEGEDGVDEYDEDDGFIASDDEWWGQDFRPGLIFERVLAARGRLNTIQIDEIVISDDEYDDLDEIVISDDEYDEYDEDSLLSPATEYEADAEGGRAHDEDLDFQRQIAEATRLSLLDQAATQQDEERPEGIATRTRSRLPERRQRRRATTTARPRSRPRRDEADGVSTTDAALVRRPRVSIIDLTGIVVDGEESSLSLPEVEPRPQEDAEPATTRRRRRAIPDDDVVAAVEEEDDEEEYVAPIRRRRTRRRLLVDIDEDEQGTTTTTTTTTTSRTRTPTRRTAATRRGGARRTNSSSSSSSSAAPASTASTDDSWLNEGIN